MLKLFMKKVSETVISLNTCMHFAFSFQVKESHCQCCKDGVKPAEVMVLKVLVEVWGQLH